DSQQEARQEWHDDDQQQHVLELADDQRQEVPDRVREQNDRDRDRQRNPHGLPEEPEVDRAAAQETAPVVERDDAGVRREQFDAADAVDRDVGDRRNEEQDEPDERRRQQAGGHASFTPPPALGGGACLAGRHRRYRLSVVRVLRRTSPLASTGRT